MYSHIMLGANDIQESKKFYDAILGAMGYEPGVIDEKGRCFYFTKSGVFSATLTFCHNSTSFYLPDDVIGFSK